MNRINQLFSDKNRDILSVYYPAGYPSADDTLPILGELQSQGVDMVEIGIPFSDPMADGVVIQQASNVALRNGMTLRLLFAQLEAMRSTVTIPVILMGYLNPIMQYGFEAFCRDCARVGVDGVIVPDLPLADYTQNYKDIAAKYNVKVIMLITPETSQERIELIDRNTDGFIYMVSTASTTGAQSAFDAATEHYFERVASMNLRNRCLVGFGISNKATYDAACRHSSGAIIGSRFVSLLQEYPDIKSAVAELVASLR